LSTRKNGKNRENLTELKRWREWFIGEILAEYGSRGVPNLGKSGAWVRSNEKKSVKIAAPKS
jgi:hypothetical protein